MIRRGAGPGAQLGEWSIQRGINTTRSQIAEAKARLSTKPQLCRSPNQHANTNSKLPSSTYEHGGDKSAVWRWSPPLAEKTIHIASGAVSGIVAMMAARWRERS